MVLESKQGYILWAKNDRELPEKDEITVAEFGVSLATSSKEDAVRFIFSLAGRPESFVGVDVYMDINHREGAGVTALLGNAEASLPPADGWEFVLSNELRQDGIWESKLIRAHLPRPIYGTVSSSSKATQDPHSTRVEVEIPKSMMGENPAQWGYLLCMRDAQGHLLDFISPVANQYEERWRIKEIRNSASARGDREVILPMLRANPN